MSNVEPLRPESTEATQPPENRRSFLSPPAFLRWVADRVGNPLDWGVASRLLVFTINGVCFFSFFGLMVLIWFDELAALPYINEAGLQLLSNSCVVFAVIWTMVALVRQGMTKSKVTSTFLIHTTIQLAAVSFSFIAYLVGPYTTPILLFYLLFITALVLFDWRPILFGLLSSALIIGITTIAEQLGAIPYAPLFNGAPVQGGRLAFPWLVIAGGTVTIFMFNLLLVLAYLVHRWRHREEMFRKLSITDSLTGIANRRHLMDLLQKRFALAERHQTHLACVMIDVDHFKSINDTHGHAMGDKVLADLTAALHSQLRKSDLIGRYGGEEFALILPETDAEGARQLAERCRKTVANTPFMLDDGGHLNVTISIGIAPYPQTKARHHEELIQKADDAMYEAKREGRNRVRLAA